MRLNNGDKFRALVVFIVLAVMIFYHSLLKPVPNDFHLTHANFMNQLTGQQNTAP